MPPFKGAKQLCGLSKDATIFYDKCHLRFSNKDILNMDSANRVNTSAVVDGALVLMNMSSEPMLPGWDPNRQATNITKFFETVLNNMAGNFLSPPRHYATIRMDMDGVRFYFLAQCAPDLIEDICYGCLNNFSDRAAVSFAGRLSHPVLRTKPNA